MGSGGAVAGTKINDGMPWAGESTGIDNFLKLFSGENVHGASAE